MRYTLTGRLGGAWIVLAGVCGCDGPTEVRDPLIQTGQGSYTLEVNAPGLQTLIDYSFTNETRGTVYVVNCGGAFDLRLERLDGSDWVPAWGPFIPDCLSPPIVIEPGGMFHDTLRVWGAPPGSNSFPQFNVDDPTGTYRLVWIDALSSYQDRLPFGPQIPLENRTSNAFELVAP